MECGYCEPVCLSRNLSLTPRQRNTVARKIETRRRTKQNDLKIMIIMVFKHVLPQVYVRRVVQ